jgi:pyridoxine 5-phosphate synthase
MLNPNKIRLGVNVDHVATLRQVRKGQTQYPHLPYFVNEAHRAGADQITIHLREDQRHIQLSDLEELAQECPLDLNLEMAVNSKMVALALKHKPEWCCFVPEKRQELTTEGGLNLFQNTKVIEKAIVKLQSRGVEISLFLDPDPRQVKMAHGLGADAIEFHTGSWVLAKGKKKQIHWLKLKKAAALCHHLGMRVHAGHGLDYEHAKIVTQLPFLKEVNIGHFLVCEALSVGFYQSIKTMVKTLKN